MPKRKPKKRKISKKKKSSKTRRVVSSSRTKHKRKVSSKKRAPKAERLYSVNKNYELLRELQALVLKASPVETPRFTSDLRKIGKIRLALMSGSFLGVDDARVDLLVVGENIRLSKLFSFIKDRETELGRELRYVILSPDEFSYRYEMFDRFLKDILETPHQKLINTLRIN